MCVLVVRAIFRICGNESHPGLQLVEKLATPLYLNGKLSAVRLTTCPLFIFSQVHLQGRAPMRDTRRHSLSWFLSPHRARTNVFPFRIFQGGLGDFFLVTSSCRIGRVLPPRPKTVGRTRGSVAEWVERWSCNLEASSLNSTLTASWISSLQSLVQILGHVCKIDN